MVAGEVGEGADGEIEAVDPAQAQRVAGHLHHRDVDTAFDHHRQQFLDVGRLRGGQGAGDRDPVDAHPDRADQPDATLGGPQPRLHQVADGGFAGGAGDADDRQPCRRAPVDDGGQLPEDGPRGGMDQHRNPGRFRDLGDPGGIGEHRHRPGGDGLRRETRAVGERTGQRGEQIAGPAVLGPQAHPGDRDGPLGAVGGRHGVEPGRQLRQRDTGEAGGARAWRHRHHLRPVGGPATVSRGGRAAEPCRQGRFTGLAASTAGRGPATAARSPAAATRTRCCGTAGRPRCPATRRRRGAGCPSSAR